MSIEDLTCGTALQRAANNARKRSQDIEGLLAFCQGHLEAFASSLAEITALSVNFSEEGLNGLRDCATAMDELDRIAEANGTLTARLTPEDVAGSCATLLEAARDGSEESSEALLALLNKRHSESLDQVAGAPSKRSAEILEALPRKMQKSTRNNSNGQESKHEAEDDDDDTIALETGEMSLTCPLTRVVFDKPMKNTQCGHTYSKDAILSYLRTQTQIPGQPLPCPVAGCIHSVTLATLVVDKKMKYAVERRKRLDEASKKRNESQQSNNDGAVAADDDDEEEEEETAVLM